MYYSSTAAKACPMPLVGKKGRWSKEALPSFVIEKISVILNRRIDDEYD